MSLCLTALARVPFNALRKQPGTGPYLVQEQPVVWVPTWATWLEQQRPTGPLFPGAIFALGYEDSGMRLASSRTSRPIFRGPGDVRSAHIDPLEETGLEGAAVHSLTGAPVVRDSEATSGRFLEHLESDGWLHFAGHARFDQADPLASCLFLGKGQSVTGRDVLARDLRRMGFMALSACETGAGSPAGGENLLGLPWALQYAGVRSLLLTQWQVRDDTAPRVMRAFYAGCRRGLPRERALQAALAAEINAGSAPEQWAPFILMGAAGPMQLDTPQASPVARATGWLAWAGAIAGLLAAGLLLRYYLSSRAGLRARS